MTGYTPPIDDMKFLIHHVIGLDQLTSLPCYNETSADLVDAILDEAGKFAAGILAPINRTGDQQGATLQEDGSVKTADGWQQAYERFREGGWQGISASPDHGGMGLPMIVGAAVSEMWQSANMAFALCPMLTAGAIELLTHHGDSGQQALYLSRMISGEWTGTMNLTEPQAGSDLSQVKTRAEPAPDGTWRITGQKIFITYGDHDLTENIVHLVLARTPNAPEGVKGISLFVVPKFLVDDAGNIGERNDVTCMSLEHKLGIHASPTCVLSFGEKNGATGYRVGEEGHGLACMFTMMNNARLAVGQQGVAISERAFQQALSYASDRQQGRDPRTGAPCAIIRHPDVARMLLQMRATTEASRALSFYAAAQLDLAHGASNENTRKTAQANADLLIPMIKAWGTDLGVENASLGVQVHGGMGFIEETGAAQHLRDARIAPIYEGTNGIQALDLIGRKVLRDKGSAAFGLISRMQETVETATSEKDADDPFIPVMRDALHKLVQTTTHVVEKCSTNPTLAQAVATPYLKLFSLCVGGWLMLRSRHAADKVKDEIGADFSITKQSTIRFYFDQVLPEIQWRMAQIENTSGAAEAEGNNLFSV
jgi:acyl-CoA dehydrogenase